MTGGGRRADGCDEGPELEDEIGRVLGGETDDIVHVVVRVATAMDAGVGIDGGGGNLGAE